MAIEIKEVKVENWKNKAFWFYNSSLGKMVDPEYLGFQEKAIRRYLIEHKMPKDKLYSEEDLVLDLTVSSGDYSVNCEKKETAEFIAELIQILIKKLWKN